MSRPQFAPNSSQPPDSTPESGGCPESCTQAPGVSQTDALWQYLHRIESGLDQIDARIDRLYIALGGGTVLLAAIGLGSAFIVRAG
ncbi:MAG: hypothetical protein F4Y69_12555 [Chloroflexi bacterium]|nr:hypothetical protein [Chloroflexota bacterium]MYF23545.1 hypothetical protein [Chloroflexota bacterium]